MDHEQHDIAAIRARSFRFIETVFAFFSLTFLAMALVAHHWPEVFMIEPGKPSSIAPGCLFLGLAYTMTMFIWELLFAIESEE